MTELRIVVQAKDDPKNLLSTKEKAEQFSNGFTIVFMQSATQSGSIGVEFIYKGPNIYGQENIVSAVITENQFEGLMGAFIGVRMRFGRMPKDQWEMVRHYMKDKAKQFLEFVAPDKRKFIENDVKRFFGI